MTTTNVVQERLSEIVRSRARSEIADRELQRAVHAARTAGATQIEIAKQLAVSQAAISKRLAQAEPLDGDDSPYDVALRYAAGDVARDEMIAKLTAFEYQPATQSPAYDEPFVDVSGSLDELVRALDRGFLSEQDYDEILLGRNAANDPNP